MIRNQVSLMCPELLLPLCPQLPPRPLVRSARFPLLLDYYLGLSLELVLELLLRFLNGPGKIEIP